MHDDDHANQYERMRVRFAAQLQALRLLEDELRQHPKHGIPERAFLDKMAIAIDYLQQAMDVLVLAAQE